MDFSNFILAFVTIKRLYRYVAHFEIVSRILSLGSKIWFYKGLVDLIPTEYFLEPRDSWITYYCSKMGYHVFWQCLSKQLSTKFSIIFVISEL